MMDVLAVHTELSKKIKELEAERDELLAAMPLWHWRKCRDCGNQAIHAESFTPWVLCRKCGSQDTRRETEGE